MKKAFETSLNHLMSLDKRYVLLLADSDFEQYEVIKTNYESRCINFGIAECNMVAAAAALAKDGMIPIIYTVGAFIAYRAFEFIRDDVCLQNLNVKIVGMGQGVKINNFGPTHHSTEDIAVLRVLPNLTIVSPASPLEVVPAFEMSLAHKGPVYIRLGKAFETEIYEESPKFEVGKWNVLKSGTEVTLIGTGNIISNLLNVAEKLGELGIDAEVLNASTIKPLDKECLIKSARKTGKIVTVEEHQINGGLGGAVSEVIATNDVNAKMEIIGFNDTFCLTYGWHSDLLEAYGLSTEQIFERIKLFVQR